MSKPTYKIYPLYLGRFPAYEKSILQMMNGFGVKVDSPAQAYLIQGDGKNILVDTGPGKEEDRVVRYGPKKDAGYTYELYQDIIDKILEKLISSGKGIEINTGGLSRGIKETNPCTDIVRRFKLMGGEIITIGSDAHTPDKIAAHFKIAESVLTECGFGYYCTFEGREPTYHRI